MKGILISHDPQRKGLVVQRIKRLWPYLDYFRRFRRYLIKNYQRMDLSFLLVLSGVPFTEFMNHLKQLLRANNHVSIMIKIVPILMMF